MAFKIIIEPCAELDVKDATAWYKLQQVGMGVNFLEDFYLSISYLPVNPFLPTAWKGRRK